MPVCVSLHPDFQFIVVRFDSQPTDVIPPLSKCFSFSFIEKTNDNSILNLQHAVEGIAIYNLEEREFVGHS